MNLWELNYKIYFFRKNMKMSFLQKIKEVFTREYRENTKYREFLKQNSDRLKLKCEERFDLEERLKKLKDDDFQSNFRVKVDDTSQSNIEEYSRQ